MSERVFVSGCSYVQDTVWPQLLFPDSVITNLGRHGAGNQYISNSIIGEIDPTNPPDYVFVLFAGVNRVDVALPKTPGTLKLLEKKKFGAVLKDTVYLFSGGQKVDKLVVDCYNKIRDDSWPEVSNFDDWISLDACVRQECLDHRLFDFEPWSMEQLVEGAWALSYLDNQSFMETQTYLAINSCISFLEANNIKYNFGFVYDPFNQDYRRFYGTLNKNNPMYHKIKWKNFVNVYPYEIGLKNDLFAEDDAHLSIPGQELFVKQLLKKINEC